MAVCTGDDKNAVLCPVQWNRIKTAFLVISIYMVLFFCVSVVCGSFVLRLCK